MVVPLDYFMELLQAILFPVVSQQSMAHLNLDSQALLVFNLMELLEQ